MHAVWDPENKMEDMIVDYGRACMVERRPGIVVGRWDVQLPWSGGTMWSRCHFFYNVSRGHYLRVGLCRVEMSC